MDHNLVGLAFAAGLVAALNPCGFAMLPAYLALVVRGQHEGALTALVRAAAATAAMTTGFLAVFGTFGVLTVAMAASVQRVLPYVTVTVGVVLVALGLWLMLGHGLGALVPAAHNARWAPTARLGSMFGYGIGYALASLSCTVGPFLAVTGAALRSASAVDGLFVYLAYAAGFALVVGALAVAAALTSTAVADRLRRIMPYLNRIGGLLLVVVGLYIAYYGIYEARLLTQVGVAAHEEDAVVAAAGRVQGAVAGWVHAHGAWPWLGAVVLLVLTAIIAARWRARRAAR